MNYYFAPMEGITGYIHRNIHHQLFPQIDKYVTAFLAPNPYGKLSSKERNDILPEHNVGICTIPQLLTNRSEDFVATSKVLASYGYKEVNLNLGCPSKTVVSKYRGSGFLAKPKELESFLEDIFKNAPIEISIKTRLGVEEPEEFYPLIELFNQYPVKELTIHPRTQREFYKSTPHWDVFREALRLCKHQICYNGDLFTAKDFWEFQKEFPQVETVMLGRGLLRNPGLIEMIEGASVLSKERLRIFHNAVFEGYKEVLFGEKPVLFKMKELWAYMLFLFDESQKQGKKIKKAEHYDRYEEAVDELFTQCKINSEKRE